MKKTPFKRAHMIWTAGEEVESDAPKYLCGERLLARAESSTERNREVPPEGEVGEKGKRMGGLRGVLTRTFGVTIFEIPRRRGLLLECSRRGTIFTRAPSKSCQAQSQP